MYVMKEGGFTPTLLRPPVVDPLQNAPFILGNPQMCVPIACRKVEYPIGHDGGLCVWWPLFVRWPRDYCLHTHALVPSEKNREANFGVSWEIKDHDNLFRD